ncbi:hypothetical protein A8C56_10615 [Niabella ginsenosidivorans]|uniref:ABC transporter ATPase n=1 Tax=Niabella ginsenosidivorans TaxID=1176587 RepID=A0A1A9I175_9BACT|nr:hypothetical protein [Niabella ginsenosidivorans]ANH81376.1 hypothetical protein A8C56_10615 [Niabella ginsenosidivorans]
MNLAYKHLLDPGFSPYSRVWVYQSSRLLSLPEALEAEELINDFTKSWVSHSDDVKAEGYLFFGQFIVLMADETHTQVSGCSTDSSVRFIKKLGEHYKVDFFDRQNLAFVRNNKIEIVPLQQVKHAFSGNSLTPDTLYFNNLVLNKAELEKDWIIPIKDSWLIKKIGAAV